MREQIERMIHDAIGTVLGSDTTQSLQNQDEAARKTAQAILDMLRPEKREAA